MTVGPGGILTAEHRALVGVETAPGYHLIEAGAVRRFCEAAGLDDPVFVDRDAALAAGHPERPVPPTFWSAIGSAGSALPAVDLGSFGARTLNGGTEYEYLIPAHVGQTVACTRRIAAIDEQAGREGPIVRIVYETLWRDRESRLLTVGRLVGLRL